MEGQEPMVQDILELMVDRQEEVEVVRGHLLVVLLLKEIVED